MKVVVFFSNLLLCNILYYYLVKYVAGKNEIHVAPESRNLVKLLKRASLLNTVVFLLVCLIGLVNAKYYYLPFIIWVIDWSIQLFTPKKIRNNSGG